MSVLSTARLNFQGLGKLFVLSHFCALFSAFFGVNLDCIGIYGVRPVKRGVILNNLEYQRGNCMRADSSNNTKQ